MTVDKLLAEHLGWCRLGGLSEATMGDRRTVVARFGRDGPGLAAADEAAVVTWLGGLAVQPTSVRTYLCHLRGFYRWAAEHRGVADPTVRVPAPREPHRVARPAGTWAEIDMATRLAPEPERSWIILAAWAGLRCCEVAPLAGRDLHDGQVRVVGKGGRARWVDAHPRVLDVFDGAPGGRLWPGVDRRAVSRRGTRWLRRSGLDATMHQLRHSFSTTTYAAGGDLLAVQQLLGHSSPATTAMYVRVGGDRTAAAVAALPA